MSEKRLTMPFDKSELAALKEWLTENDITYVDDCTLTEEAQKLAALLEREG